MKETKIKAKANKESEQQYNYEVNAQSRSRGTVAHIDKKQFNKIRDRLQIYNVNEDSTNKTWGKNLNNSPPEKNPTNYEAFNSSTSESDRERRPKSDRRYTRESGKKLRDADNEVCITTEGGKGNVRIVGNASGPNKLPAKQVEFVLLDAVYVSTSEGSSDEEADEVQLDQNNTHKVEGQDNIVTQKGLNSTGLSGKDSERDQSPPEKENAQDNVKSGRNQGIASEQIDSDSRAQPTLAMPLISVKIQTSHEEPSHDFSKNKIDTTTKNPSSRLLTLKQHLLENGVGGNLEKKHYETPGLDTLGAMEKGKGYKDAGQIGNNSENQIYYVNNTSTDATDLRNALEKLLLTSKEGTFPHNSFVSQIETKSQSRIELKNIGAKNKYDDIVNNALKSPLIYVATLDSDAVGQGFKNKEPNENILKVASKTSPKTVSLKKSLSKQSSKKRSDVIGSKISMKKSNRSFLKSSIPKPSSVSSRRKSSVSVDKINQLIEGRSSKKYVIRDIMVIPEEQVGQQFADIYPAQPHENDIPEETVTFTEREIKLHNLNNGSINEADNLQSLTSLKKQDNPTKKEQNTLHRNSPMTLNNIYEGGSIPCLYYCSTSTLDSKGGTRNCFVVNAMTECHTIQKPLAPGPSSARQQDNDVIDDRNVLSNYDNKSNTILLDSETHKDIMEAIDASNGKERIISIPSKLSRKESAGKRLSFVAKRSKGGNSLKRQGSLVEKITEEYSPDEIKDNLQIRNIKSIQMGSTDVFDVAGYAETDRSETSENWRKFGFNDQPGKNEFGFNTEFTAMPVHTLPLDRLYDEKINDKKSPSIAKKPKKRTDKNKPPKHGRKRESKVRTILSFTDPLFTEELNSNIKGQHKSNADKVQHSPETMVYVGRLPNTTYNVFFSPETTTSMRQEESVKESVKESLKSEKKPSQKTVSVAKSEKLLAQGPKAILIFVNKKTELNRNPFDGNVMYDDDGNGLSTRSKSKRDKGHGKGKGKDRLKRGKSRNKSTKSGRSDFDVTSMRDPGSQRGDGVVIEKSPSGLKTVVKYPCGCLKITKIDPENGIATNEITSAFCRLGSKCQIGQSQKGKRLLTYPGEGGERSTYRELPASPHLDIVIEGIMSKKPIKQQAPAEKMRGANLTGTLTINTNRCNGVFNFYIDPRVKQYLRNNLPCITNKDDNVSFSKYSRY